MDKIPPPFPHTRPDGNITIFDPEYSGLEADERAHEMLSDIISSLSKALNMKIEYTEGCWTTHSHLAIPLANGMKLEFQEGDCTGSCNITLKNK